MDQSYPDTAWTAHMTELRGTFQATYETMTRLLDETSAQWETDLQAVAGALEKMRALDRQRQQILGEVTQRMARLHALFLRTALGPGPEAVGLLERRPRDPDAVSPPSLHSEAPPPPPVPEAVGIPPSASRDPESPDPAGGDAPQPDPVVWADAEAPRPEPVIPWADDPRQSPPEDDSTAPASVQSPPTYANPAATYGPPLPTADEAPAGEPVLPRLVQSF